MKVGLGWGISALVIGSIFLVAAAPTEDKGTFWELVDLGKPDLKVVTDP